MLAGIVLIIAGFGFKIATVPFHMWVPDVYEGAPTPITAYLSVGSKAAGFAVIIRVFSTAFGNPALAVLNWGMIFAILAAITMTVGNVLAIPQTNIKRMLGYSSIAQAGYIMVGLATIGITPAAAISGQSSLVFFLVSYALTNLGAFIAIIAISNKVNSDEIKDFSGMIKRARRSSSSVHKKKKGNCRLRFAQIILQERILTLSSSRRTKGRHRR